MSRVVATASPVPVCSHRVDVTQCDARLPVLQSIDEVTEHGSIRKFHGEDNRSLGDGLDLSDTLVAFEDGTDTVGSDRPGSEVPFLAVAGDCGLARRAAVTALVAAADVLCDRRDGLVGVREHTPRVGVGLDRQDGFDGTVTSQRLRPRGGVSVAEHI